MRKLIATLAAILVLILAGDLHATPLAVPAPPEATFSPVEKVACPGWRPYCTPGLHRACGHCWCAPCGRYRYWQNPWDRRWWY
jgi:hypothetical protein